VRPGRKAAVPVKVHVLHENPQWYPPFAEAFDAAGVPHEQWLLGEGALDLDEEPPPGVFWSRMSASSHTRGHLLAKDHARAVLAWLEAHGRRVVNGRRVLELEMSKADQLAALRASGIDVPRTVAVVGAGAAAGRAALLDAAGKFPAPFIVKHNQGGKGLGVRLVESVEALAQYLDSAEYEPPVDGITLVQEYLRAAEPFITRVELVGGEFVYAITADTARGGFELCPADACAVPTASSRPSPDTPADGDSLFALREGFDGHPIIGRYLEFSRRHGLEVAGFEFIETADGRLVTYDVNTNTNYNPQVEAAAPRSGPGTVARYLKGLLHEPPGADGGGR
jgi:RimK-like ATP-grasp domain